MVRLRTALVLGLVLAVSGAAISGPAFIAESPALLTSAGQSADLQIVKVLLDRLRVPTILKNLARPDDLREAKTLVMVIGGSTKGLGAAGIDADGEMARVQSLLARAGETATKVLSLHVGGAARRGDLSDRFINAVVPRTGHLIVISEGNSDGLFTRLSTQHRVTLESLERLADIEPVLRRIFAVR